MSWRTGSAMVTVVAAGGCILAHLATPAGATISSLRSSSAPGLSLLHKAADSGIDIVRMPPRPPSPPSPAGPSVSPQPPVAPPPSYPPAAPPAQAQGRLVKATVRVGSQPRTPQRGWLGVQMDGLEPSLMKALAVPAADGVLILEASANGPASQAGLRLGDVIISLDRRPVQFNDLRQRVAAFAPGTEAEFEVWRVAADGDDFLQTLRRFADEGNADAMFRLGRTYAAGLGVARNDTEAVAWYRKASAAGNASASTALAVALIDGRGAGKDPQEGVRLLRAAADKGNTDAMYRLGIVLSEGKVTAKDTAEALRLFTRGAEAGHVPSMLDLALMYNNGEGATADPAKAAQWYKRAADLGSTPGMVNLGFMHQQGKGVERNDITAVALYRRAAAEGNPSGIHNLAAMLDSGRGVARKDPEQAAQLIMQALDLRNEFTFRQMSQNSRAWSPEFRRALQKRLRDAGFYSGKIDGELRDTTVTAISAYMNRAR
ncbi:MAG TPA: PDZ domain-containing protein [Hyphomicrobiaceae bacterium]|nr:PDZ domain-containing protein [Hyphomicrobiaceae bacterium]